MKLLCKLAAIPLFFLSVTAVRGQDMSGQTVPVQRSTPALVRISGGVMAGLRISFVQPVYPPEAKAKHIAGTVVFHAVISKNGTIEKLDVISGPEELQLASITAVRQWRYKPYLLNGEPVEVDTTITVNFDLGSAPPNPAQS